MMKRIFLVEDDREIAKNLSLLLHAEGFMTTHAKTKAEASEKLAEQKFDLALVDIALPDLYGDQGAAGYSGHIFDGLRR